MSFIYNLAATWNDAATVFNGIEIDVTNGAGGQPVYKDGSKLIRLNKRGVDVFSVDPLGAVTSSIYFTSGKPWVDVGGKGADPTAATDSYAAFAAAIVTLQAIPATNGGILRVPPGSYLTLTKIVLPTNITMEASGIGSTVLRCATADITVLQLDGTRSGVANISIFGKGLNNDNSTFGATQNAVIVNCTGGLLFNCLIWGGYNPIALIGDDNTFFNVSTNSGYGLSNCYITGAGFFIKCGFDFQASGITITDSYPYAAWAALTNYVAGQARNLGGFTMVCKTGGQSGAVSPTLKNYGINIADGTVVWLLSHPQNVAGVYCDTGSDENHFNQCDLSGAYGISFLCNSATAIVYLADSICSSQIDVINAGTFKMHDNEITEDVSVSTLCTGRFFMHDNETLTGSAPVNVDIGANVSDFKVDNNWLGGGTININAGTSNHYTVLGNVRCTVTDNALGVNRAVANNVA